MTDRIREVTIVLDGDWRIDAAQDHIVPVLKSLNFVKTVVLKTKPSDREIIEQEVFWDIRKKLFEVLK